MRERAGPAKRKPQLRAEETKRRLTQATIELMVERGYARLSVTDIMKRAAVSNGARVHHFPTKSDLVIAAVGKFLQHGNRSGADRARKGGGPAQILHAMTNDLYSLYFEEFFVPAMESAVAARTDPVLAKGLHPVIAEYHRKNRGIWIDALQRAGYSPRDASTLYEMCKWVLRGMALTSVWHSTPAANRHFLAAMRNVLQRAIRPRRTVATLGDRRASTRKQTDLSVS